MLVTGGCNVDDQVSVEVGRLRTRGSLRSHVDGGVEQQRGSSGGSRSCRAAGGGCGTACEGLRGLELELELGGVRAARTSAGR